MEISEAQKKVDQWIPHLLNDSHKLKRFEICNSLLIRNKTDNFLHRIITCDEKWVLLNNRKRSAQCLDVAEAQKRFPEKNNDNRLVVYGWGSTLFFSRTNGNYHSI